MMYIPYERCPNIISLGISMRETRLSCRLLRRFFCGRGLDECYYWGYELHYSGFDVFPIIWKIYYDFYFVSNPGLETLIRHKEKMWERNKKLHYLAATISNLVNTPSSGEVFIMRQYIERVLISESGCGLAERGIYCARKTSCVVWRLR